MKFLFFYCISIIFLVGCKKDHSPKVEIYLLKSFSSTVNTQPPYATVLTNVVLEAEPLVKDNSIVWFSQSTTTFKLRQQIGETIKGFSVDNAFAVTVDGKPVYTGIFHPAYLSSIAFNIALIDPSLYDKDYLKIDFVLADPSDSGQYDKRRDDRLLKALAATGRLFD